MNIEIDDFQNLVGFCTKHKYLVLSAVGIGLGVVLLRRYFAGGLCRSQARLDGKTVIITGGNTGIGKETARDLASRGARVILACRDITKAERAAADIRSQTGNKNVVVGVVDLASLRSIRKFVQEILQREENINILINNAGVMMCPYWKTEDGFEMQFGTNHLGHFLLTNLLLERMKESAPARIITVSSITHERMIQLDFDNLNSEKGYNPLTAYQQSKLANVLFTKELSKRLNGTRVTANSVNPGFVQTELGRHLCLTIPLAWRFLSKPLFLFAKSPTAGAQTSIYCSVAEELEHVSGKYFSDCAIREESKAARDDEAARKLWKVSEKMVGLK